MGLSRGWLVCEAWLLGTRVLGTAQVRTCVLGLPTMLFHGLMAQGFAVLMGWLVSCRLASELLGCSLASVGGQFPTGANGWHSHCLLSL